ncbi:MAG: TetR/AcrR family transcriptional regulator [Bacteroidales bacterium]|nr:TetR/AcrR family transcriptional regulator [Bacteroidales bacterium]
MGLHFVTASPNGLLKVNVPILFMQRKKDTRELILSQTYQLLFVYNWEAITIEQIESSIGRTRGAIFYFFKNKNELFNSIINERFLSKFLTTEVNTSAIQNTTITGFFNQYQTPFERLCNDISDNYDLKDPTPAVLNIIVQARKLYPCFDIIIGRYISDEIQYIEKNAVIMRDNPRLINSFKTYCLLKSGTLLLSASQQDLFNVNKHLQSYINGIAYLLGE